MVDDLFEAENCGELMTWDDNGTPWVNREAIAETLVPKGWSKPRTVNSATELDALPVGSVVWTPALVGPVGHIFVKCAGMWIIPWHDTAEDPLEQNGSVTVVFTPGDAG
jgi:hypothetical protein